MKRCYCRPIKVGIDPLRRYRMLHRKGLYLNRMPEKDSGSTNQTEKTVETSKVKPPFVGAVVILHLGETDPTQNNQSMEMPAIITRVWSITPPFTVNLKGIPDGTGTIWRTSVMHQNPYEGAVIAQNPGWRWPDEELERGTAPMEQTD